MHVGIQPLIRSGKDPDGKAIPVNGMLFNKCLQSSSVIFIIIFHRIIASFELEGILKGHLVQLPFSEQGHLQ